MDALIFIDTNIFLDFYRIRKSEVSMSYLKHIDDHKDRIITGGQIEMEYKKNRQKVILDSLGKFKSPDWNNLSVPAIFSESDESKEIEKLKKSISEQQLKINKKIEGLLKDPVSIDPVFSALSQLFYNKTEFNLNQNHKDENKIQERATRRFLLGYPPRKDNDTSIGDSINWEWIVECASKSKKNVILVTRDDDYGTNRKDESFVNDWLQQEFKERVGNGLDVILTSKLSNALELIDVTVTEEMIEEEDMMIEGYEGFDMSSESDSVTKKIFEILKDYKN